MLGGAGGCLEVLGGAVALGKSGIGPDVNLWWYGGMVGQLVVTRGC